MVVRLWRQADTADAAETRVSHSTNKACLRRKQDLFIAQTRLIHNANKASLHCEHTLVARQGSLVCSRTEADRQDFDDVAGRKRRFHCRTDVLIASRRCQKFLPKWSVALSDICLFRRTAVRLFRRRSRGASSRVRPTCCRRHSGIRRRCRGVRRWGCPCPRAGRRADRGQRHAH